MSDNQKNIEKEEEIVDPVEQMLKKTGCIDLHYQVLECNSEKKDWRLCKKEVQEFKACMTKYQEQQKLNRF
ncbi:hypothetical protein HCN44_001431 [Aphidius gifuensis]|uniref:Uncharacterized protein n=1 Tax=Aphidius gifuensis TaxID=684658 RepID=A0A834XTU6_APHGI|nr:cytochrome c oxidase assembly factor 4 homolog, mitochondrial [Aphidius gifuensis]KAF7992106.1 hypothetical protein HCN44_001431 [Aphidius gifuensis]